MSNNHLNIKQKEREKKQAQTEQRVPVMAIQQIK